MIGAPHVVKPRTIGEILDLSVRTCVRNVTLLFLPIAAITVPVGVLQLVITPNASPAFPLSGGIGPSAPIPPAFALISVVAGFVEVAIPAIVAAALVTGAPPDVGAAIRRSFARLVLMIGVTAAYILMSIPLVIAATTSIYGFATWNRQLSASEPLAHAVGVALLAIGGGVLLIVALPAILAVNISVVAVLMETSSIFEAVKIGLRRTFTGRLMRRSLVAGIAFVLVEGGGGLVEGASGIFLAALLQAAWIKLAISVIAHTVLGVLGMVFIVCYSLDAQARLDADRARALAEVPA